MSNLLRFRWLALFLSFWTGGNSLAQSSLPINLQGRVTVDGLAFTGNGRFKFALGQGPSGGVFWTHDGTSPGTGGEPTGFVEMPVVRGLYSIMLGDTTVPGITQPIPASIFTNLDVRVRIWFNDGAHGYQRLQPDQRLGAVPYSVASDKAREASILTGTVALSQLPSNLITNGSTNVTFTGRFNGDGSGLIGLRGSTPWTVVPPTGVDMVPNTGYLVVNSTETQLQLPSLTGLQIGDVVRVAGPVAGSWKIIQRPGQTIASGRFSGGLGTSWIPRDAVRNWSGLAATPNGKHLVAGLSGGNGQNPIMMSTNFGVNWFVPNPVSVPQRNWTSFAGSEDGLRWVAGTLNNNVFTSIDFGQTWIQKTAQFGQANWSGVACSADGSNMVAVAQNGFLLTSTNCGEQWINRTAPGSPAWTCVAASSDGLTVLVGGNNATLFVSKDKGASWAARQQIRAWTAAASSTDGTRLAAAPAGYFIHTSPDGGATWLERPASGARNWTSIASSGDGLKLAAIAAGAGTFISIDGGNNWTLRNGSPGGGTLVMTPDAQRLAAAVPGSYIFTSLVTPLKNTTVGLPGYLLGDEFSSVELQYVGNGIFFPLTSGGTIYAF